MEGKNTFVLYKSWLSEIKELSDEDAGKLFKSILDFVNGIEYEVDNNIEGIFLAITEQIVLEWSKFNQKTSKYHWNYKGGISDKNHIIRNSTAMKEWRNKVFIRDKYTCQCCKEIGGELNAHHIKKFSMFPELRFDISNGLTLCKSCHIDIHKTST